MATTTTTASIPAEWYRVGWVPPVCARHGRPATAPLKRTFYTRTPGWVYLLIVLSLAVAAIVSLAIRKSARGTLPGCDRCVAERRRFVWSAVGGWVLALGILFPALGADGRAAGLVAAFGLLLLIAAFGWTLSGDRVRVRGHLRKDLVWLDLTGVSPEFASEVRAELARTQPAQGTLAARAAAEEPPIIWPRD